MQDATFRTTLQEIRTLHETEGPHTNIFANKFKAREKLFELRRVLLESLPKAVELNEDAKQSSVMLTQIQLCEVYLMIGNNLYETEEEKEALQTLLRTYRMLLDALREAAYSYAEEPTYELEALLTTSNLIAPNAETATPEDYTHIGLHLDVLNSIAIVLSSRDQRQRIEDARIVLHYAESLYCSWDEWAKRNSIPYATRELDAPQPDGKDGGEDTLELEAWRTRDRCEKAYTITVFYLAQTYGGSDTVQASKYCHYTLARQLISRKEFSHKEWATNALHLSGFYLSEEDYPSAMYFIDAAIVVAPTKDSPRGATDEDIDEIQANIQLAIARMYRFILQQSEMRLEASHGRSDKEQDCDAVGPRPDRVKISSWWVDLALPQIVKKKPEEFAYAATFEQARKYFLIALDNFNTAAKNYYVLSGMCTDHIQIQMDISDLYKVLVPFEKDVDRKCAMHARRAQALEELPDRLNPQAYHTYIQKLCFELGEIYSDILDIRLGCRSQSKTSETASTNNKGTPGRVSDKKLRELGEKSKAYYIRFVEAFNLRETGRLPSDFDKELHPTYIRALMRIARMETRAPATDPKSEYDAIQRSLDRYKGVLQFVGQYKVTDPSLHHELEICREMTMLLPGKMKEVWKVFHKICN